MLDRLLRQRTRPPDGPEAPGDAALRSHVFPRFLKWLSAHERPAVLDLGRLSGGNIEILARLGCRVQVEDVMRAAEEVLAAAPTPSHAAEPLAAAALPQIPETAVATIAAPAVTEPAPAGAAAATPGTPSAAGAGPTARPTRHIVLPPRVFGTGGARGGVNGTTGAANGAHGSPGYGHARRPAPIPLPLPTHFAYPDESFDAIVGWDLFNYYGPEASRRLGSDIVRLLRPGGIVFATFHARREEAPDGPGRHRIVDESHLHVEPHAGPAAARHLYQNRDIEKTFAGLKIVELYFLRHGVREMLLEKRPSGAPPAIGGPARPRPRFRIE